MALIKKPSFSGNSDGYFYPSQTSQTTTQSPAPTQNVATAPAPTPDYQTNDIRSKNFSTGIFGRLASVGKSIGNFGVGFAKGVASLPAEMASFGSDVGLRAAALQRPDATLDQLKQATQSRNGIFSGITKDIQQGVQKTKEDFAPQGTAQGVGFGAEKVGEFLVPGAIASKASKAATFTTNMQRLAAKALTETAGNVLVSGSQRGELNAEDIGNSLLTGGLSAAGKIPQAAFAAYQTGKGAKELYEGNKTGGIIDLGFGLLSLVGAKNAKGPWLDLPPEPMAAKQKAVQNMERILTSKSEDKRQLKNALKNNPKKSPFETAVDHGVIPTWDEATGKLNTVDAAQDVQGKIEKWDTLLDDVLSQNPQKRHNLDDVASRALADVSNSGESATAQRRTKERILSYIEDEKARLGGNMASDKEANVVKRGLYREGFDKGRKLETEDANAANALARVLKGDIETKSGISQVKQVNGVIGELSDLRRVLENANGKAVRGGILGKWMKQLLGATVGSAGGPVGSMVGAHIAESMNARSIDPYLATIAAQKKLDLSGYVPEWKNVQKQAIDELINNIARPKNVPMLEAPKQINLPERMPNPFNPAGNYIQSYPKTQ